MTPAELIDSIPAAARKWIYGVLGVVHGTEVALDLVGWGLVPDELQLKVITVLTALGFGLAFRKTTDEIVVRD